jgi:hypothetical protein
MLLAAVTRPVTIEPWEYLMVLVYLAGIGVVYSRRKNLEIARNPEFRYYILGIYAKILGSVFFSLIYVYYYGNGDTISFFNSARPLANLMISDPARYLRALFEESNWTNYYSTFDPSSGYPIGYIYMDQRSYVLVKMISPIVLITMHNYLLSGVVVATIAFGGVWSLYRTLVRYYPRLHWELAIAVLFFPSTVFWGSGIMKDTFTFTALGWYVHCIDRIFFLKKGVRNAWIIAVVSAALMIAMKPYVFMMIFPATVLWVLYRRITGIRNVLIRLIFLPFMVALFMGFTIFTLVSLGDRFDKFSLDRALQTVVTAQDDMKRSEQYGENYFDLGDLEATWGSVMSKFPQATFAGLFRPALTDVSNVVMALAALENTWLLLFFIRILIRSRIVHFFTLLRVNPLLQVCFLFTMGYAFMIGVTTPNFGAMVRFKIPLLPLFVAGMYITSYILDRRREVLRSGKRFSFDVYADGDPQAHVVQVPPAGGRRRVPRPGPVPAVARMAP